MVLYSGRFTEPWTADVPLSVVASRLAAELRPFFPNLVSSTENTVRVQMFRPLLLGPPVVGVIWLHYDQTMLTARYMIGVERLGLFLLLLGGTVAAYLLPAIIGQIDPAGLLLTITLVLAWLGFAYHSLSRWIDPFDNAFRKSIPPS